MTKKEHCQQVVELITTSNHDSGDLALIPLTIEQILAADQRQALWIVSQDGLTIDHAHRIENLLALKQLHTIQTTYTPFEIATVVTAIHAQGKGLAKRSIKQHISQVQQRDPSAVFTAVITDKEKVLGMFQFIDKKFTIIEWHQHPWLSLMVNTINYQNHEITSTIPHISDKSHPLSRSYGQRKDHIDTVNQLNRYLITSDPKKAIKFEQEMNQHFYQIMGFPFPQDQADLTFEQYQLQVIFINKIWELQNPIFIREQKYYH